jgi:hypothetical protein
MRVRCLWWNKGPDGSRVWSFIDNDTIRQLIRSTDADTVAILHNHPNPDPSRYCLSRPSTTDLSSAAVLHKLAAGMGANLLEFICERGVPHLYYAAFTDQVIPVQLLAADIASSTERGLFTRYFLRKELAKTTLGDLVPGAVLDISSLIAVAQPLISAK